MGNNSTRLNNCCSCLEQTQVGENQIASNNYSLNKKLNTSTIQRSHGSNLSTIQEDQKRSQQSTNYQFILVGEKQSGKTTLINLLKNNITSTPLPTQCKNQSIQIFIYE